MGNEPNKTCSKQFLDSFVWNFKVLILIENTRFSGNGSEENEDLKETIFPTQLSHRHILGFVKIYYCFCYKYVPFRSEIWDGRKRNLIWKENKFSLLCLFIKLLLLYHLCVCYNRSKQIFIFFCDFSLWEKCVSNNQYIFG